jgi:hypothetical protein
LSAQPVASSNSSIVGSGSSRLGGPDIALTTDCPRQTSRQDRAQPAGRRAPERIGRLDRPAVPLIDATIVLACVDSPPSTRSDCERRRAAMEPIPIDCRVRPGRGPAQGMTLTKIRCCAD